MRRRTVLAALVLAACAGCGLTPEPAPRQVTDAPSPAPVPADPTVTGVVQIYLVRGERLVPVDRAGRTADDALALLAAGPTPLDGDAGLTTSLPPRALRRAAREGADVVAVELTSDLDALPGRSGLLAAAQVVWTATGVCCGRAVRVLVDGRPVRVPTDSGPVDHPVGREDYRTVSPG